MSHGKVYTLVKKIPRGRVTTYGAIAKRLRLPGGARVVGYAMASCPSGAGVPWHRVIGASGKILIAEPHRSLQRRLLESEGIEISGNAVNLDVYGWTIAAKRAKPIARKRIAKPGSR